jgi:thiamine-phosphate diphosphorylase
VSGTADLRLIVVTDRALAAPRTVEAVVSAALDGGAPAIQLRDKSADAATLLEEARVLLPLVRRYGALLFINDRLDVALAAGADGVHLGPDDLPVAAARAVAPEILIGYSTDDPERARTAQQDGASYIGCGAVFGTRTKDVGDEAIGIERLRAVVQAVDIPVVGIGGITGENAGAVAAAGAAGAAVVSALMRARAPAATAREVLGAFSRR